VLEHFIGRGSRPEEELGISDCGFRVYYLNCDWFIG
jgi:hypothetical protein